MDLKDYNFKIPDEKYRSFVVHSLIGIQASQQVLIEMLTELLEKNNIDFDYESFSRDALKGVLTNYYDIGLLKYDG